MKRVLSFLLLVALSAAPQALGQRRPVLTDEETVSETVTAEVNELFRSEDFLKKKAKKFPQVQGFMVIDIGVVRNGKVSTFFKADSDIRDIDFINWMSAYILEHKFRFRLPKQQRYKIRYTATFQ